MPNVTKEELAEALRMTINTLTEIYLQSESWQYERRPNPPWWNLGDNAKAAILRCSFLSRLDAEQNRGGE